MAQQNSLGDNLAKVTRITIPDIKDPPKEEIEDLDLEEALTSL